MPFTKGHKINVGHKYWGGGGVKGRSGKYKRTEETKIKMSLSKTGSKNPQFGNKGEENHLWIKDRTKLVKKQIRNDYSYVNWRKLVWKRDVFKCRIDNNDCKGRIEAHHILPWKDFPELRYNINNGITLCHFHHPKVRIEEKRLIPFFQRLVEVNGEIC